MYVRVNAAW